LTFHVDYGRVIKKHENPLLLTFHVDYGRVIKKHEIEQSRVWEFFLLLANQSL
jgi:hypothetical protein